MKSIGGSGAPKKDKKAAEQPVSNPAPETEAMSALQIQLDLSKVKIELLFEDAVGFGIL